MHTSAPTSWCGAVLFVGIGACTPPPAPWADQLAVDGPCHRVDLNDGLDDGAELQELFRCLDHHGHLEVLRPSAAALSQPHDGTRPDDLLVEAQQAAITVELDPFAGAVAAATWLADPSRPTQDVLDVTAELLSGVPATQLSGAEPPHHVLSTSPLSPLAPVLPGMAEGLLAQPAALAEVADALAHDAAPAWLSAAATASATAGVDRVVQALGEARPETLSPGNDRHPGATGDSLRDAVDVWWLHDDAILASLTPELALLLEGPGRRAALTDAIAAAHASGAVDDLGPSLRWLTEVDPQGRPLGTGDPSALARMVRVLALTNQPVECELGLGPVGVSWSFDNLAVRLLELVARLDDDAIDSAGSLFSALTGGPVSDSLLRAAVATGTCPAITTETLDDLDAVALLFTADAAATRIVAVEVLRALPTGALPTVADALETVWLGGGMAPLEELLRDVGHTPGVGGLARLLGVLARDDAPTVQALLALVHQLSIDPARRDRLDHLGRVLLGPDASWEAIDRLAVLVAHPDSRSAELPSLARAVLAADPDLALLEPLRALLVEESVVRPLLEAARAPRVVEAVLPATSSPDAPAPLVWLAPQLVDGTIADLVELVSRVLVAAGVSPEPTQRRAP